MKIQFTVYSIDTQEVLVEGDYGSDYKPQIETLTTLVYKETFKSEEEAENFIQECNCNATFVILKEYIKHKKL